MSKQIVKGDSALLSLSLNEKEKPEDEEGEEGEQEENEQDGEDSEDDETDEEDEELNEEKIQKDQKTEWTLDSDLEEWVSLLIKQPRILLYEKAKQLKINSQVVRLSKDVLSTVSDYDWKNFVIRIAIILQLINSQQWLSLHKDQKLSKLIDSKIATPEKQKIAEEIVYSIHNNYPGILTEVNSFRQMGSWQLIQKLNSFDAKSDKDPTLNELQDIIKKFRFLKNLQKNSDLNKAGDLIIKAKEELENHGIFQEAFKVDDDPFDHLMNLEINLLHTKLCQNLKTLIQMAGILELGIDYHQISTSELAHKVILKLKDLHTIKRRTYSIPIKMVELIKECILTERREKLSPSAAKIVIITKQLCLDPKDLNQYIKEIAANLIKEKADIALLAEWLNINLNGHYLRKDKIIDLFIRTDLSLMDKFFKEDSDDSRVIVEKFNIRPQESKVSLNKLRQSKELMERIKKNYSEDEIQDLIEDMSIEIPEDHDRESGYYLMQHIFKGMEFILKDPKELEVYLEHSVQKKIISNKFVFTGDTEELYGDPDFFDVLLETQYCQMLAKDNRLAFSDALLKYPLNKILKLADNLSIKTLPRKNYDSIKLNLLVRRVAFVLHKKYFFDPKKLFKIMSVHLRQDDKIINEKEFFQEKYSPELLNLMAEAFIQMSDKGYFNTDEDDSDEESADESDEEEDKILAEKIKFFPVIRKEIKSDENPLHKKILEEKLSEEAKIRKLPKVCFSEFKKINQDYLMALKTISSDYLKSWKTRFKSYFYPSPKLTCREKILANLEKYINDLKINLSKEDDLLKTLLRKNYEILDTFDKTTENQNGCQIEARNEFAQCLSQQILKIIKCAALPIKAQQILLDNFTILEKLWLDSQMVVKPEISQWVVEQRNYLIFLIVKPIEPKETEQIKKDAKQLIENVSLLSILKNPPPQPSAEWASV